jgi:site-specific DNA recombinase
MSQTKAFNNPIRCAIYTRKSSEEGLAMEFNSLDAQREAAEAFIASQKAQGWVCLSERYDDGGFTGGNMDRPAIERLVSDIQAGKIDCVVVYKVDRLSRSLLDFARIMGIFDNHNVSFVSVTQHFNTTHSMGRLTLNILLSFAQFEREIIGERIRDKLAAQKKRGQWAGGQPVLGYDVDRTGPSPKLVVNQAEAVRVLQIFKLYLERESLTPVVAELRRRGWKTKSWTTKAGAPKGGQPFNKSNVHEMITNPIFAGKTRHKDHVYEGQHPAIVDIDVFNKVQALLAHNGRFGSKEMRNKYGALLRGLVRCHACDAAMVHIFSSKQSAAGLRYRYYRCTGAIKSGAGTCPGGSLPAHQVESVVVEKVREVLKASQLLEEVIAKVRKRQGDVLKELEAETAAVTQELLKLRTSQKRALVSSEDTVMLADLVRRIDEAEKRLEQLVKDKKTAEKTQIDARLVGAEIDRFDGLWANLSPREQTKVIALVVQCVEYHADRGELKISFHDVGQKTVQDKGKENAA